MANSPESCVSLDDASVDRVARELFRCVQKGHLTKAMFIMKNKSREDRKCVVSKTFGGNAALFEACQQGLLTFVNFLLDECDADIEQRGVYFYTRSNTMHKVTPLWFSAVSNRREILKTLLKHGADVNASSDTLSTPVRSACYTRDLETVRLLFEHGADIHKPNFYGGTCLINSVQCVHLCRFLLENGVAVNAQDHSGNAALHYAIREEKIETVELLLKHGADASIKNEVGDDAFRAASIRGFSSALDLLIQQSRPPIQRQIESHELLGTNFADYKNDTEKALQKWQTAMRMRQENNMMLTSDDIKPPLPAYMNHVEAITPEELTALADSPDRVYTQSLIIRERVLGTDHRETVFGVMHRGAIYAESFGYQRCVDLWMYAFSLRYCYHGERLAHRGRCVLQALCRLFLEMHEEHSSGNTAEAVRYEDASQIFNTICEDVETAILCSKDGVLQIASQEDHNVLVMLLLHIIRLLDIITHNPDDVLAFRHRLYKLLKNKCSLVGGQTLVHLALDDKISIIGGQYFSKFPNIQVVKLLIECGADVNAVDSRKNTPLHVCSKRVRVGNLDYTEKAQSAKLAELLIANGAHMDARNKRGKLASDGLNQLPLRLPLRAKNPMTLKCLAARMVRSSEIAYEGEVPKSLHKFIELH